MNAYTSTRNEKTTELLVHKVAHLLITTDSCEQIRNHWETVKQGIHRIRMKEAGEQKRRHLCLETWVDRST